MINKPPVDDEEQNGFAEEQTLLSRMQFENSMRENSTNQMMKWSLIVAIPVILILGFLIWAVIGAGRLNQSMNGGSKSVSTTMEPYELIFKSRFKDGQRVSIDKNPYEWKIVVPRAFVVKEIGSPANIYDSITSANDNVSYSATLHTVFKPQSSDLSPAVNASEIELKTQFVGITLENQGTYTEISNGDDCMPSDDFFKLIESRGGVIAPANKMCSLQTARCEIYTHYHGWGISLFVTRTSFLFTEPKKACAVARSFLDKYTSHVDNIIFQKK